MLVSSITQFRPVALLALPHIDSANVIHPATVVSPPLDHILQASEVLNVQAFGAHTIAPLPPGQLAPAHVVNASVIHTPTIGPTAPTTDYANTGGMGDRTAIITITTDATLASGTGFNNCVDGSYVGDANNAFGWANGQSGRHFTFDFGAGEAVYITEAKLTQNGASTHGTWKWQGSNNGTDFVDISAPFSLGGFEAAPGKIQGDLSANASAYRYYRLQQTAGTTASLPWQMEWVFKIDGL